MDEWDKAAYQVTAHRSSFGELVCLFIAPMSFVSFYPFEMYCVFVCKFGESFMAVIDGLVVVYFIGESLKCKWAVAPEGYLLVVEGDEFFCSMLDGCRFGLEDSTVVFHFEGMLCDGFCVSVGYNKPATCTMFSFGSVCKAANVMGTCFYDVRVESVFVVLLE